jgi:hypothetical protein
MPEWNYCAYPKGTTAEEFAKILELRLQALEDATKEPARLFPMPVQWRWGWKAYVRIQGRDRDGSLKVSILVEGPRGELPYVRSVRLVRSTPLPYELGKTLRES